MHKTDAEIGDIKRARMLFDSLVKSNPKHAPGWIAAARVEEHAGRMVAARKFIKDGCEHCPKSEDVWLEAARLHVSVSLLLKLINLLKSNTFRAYKMPKLYLQMLCNIFHRAFRFG